MSPLSRGNSSKPLVNFAEYVDSVNKQNLKSKTKQQERRANEAHAKSKEHIQPQAGKSSKPTLDDDLFKNKNVRFDHSATSKKIDLGPSQQTESTSEVNQFSDLPSEKKRPENRFSQPLSAIKTNLRNSHSADELQDQLIQEDLFYLKSNKKAGKLLDLKGQAMETANFMVGSRRQLQELSNPSTPIKDDFDKFMELGLCEKARDGGSQNRVNAASRSRSCRKAFDKENDPNLYNFRPMLAKKSLEIASKMGDPGERLVNNMQNRRKNIEDMVKSRLQNDCSFTPKINRKSRFIDEKNMLINDLNGFAVSRHQKLYLKVIFETNARCWN